MNALKTKAQQKPTTNPTVSRVMGPRVPNRVLNRCPTAAPIVAGNTK